jgi:hypothetical protein
MIHPSLLAGAAGVTAGVLALTPLSFAAPLPIFMIGLSTGWYGAAIGTVAATVLLALVASTSLAALFVVMQGGPPVLLVRQALLSRAGPQGTEWYPPEHLLAWITGYGALMLLVVLMLFSEQAALLLAETKAAYMEAFSQILADLPKQDSEVLISEIVRWVFAAAAGGWVITMVLNGLAAQGLLIRFGKNIRPASGPMDGLDLPLWLLAGLAIAATAAWAWQSEEAYGRAWLVVFAIPFAIHGLIRMHWLSRKWPARFIALLAFYGLLFFMFPWSLMALTVWGLVEQLLRIRRQRNGTGNGQEKE